MAECIDWLPDGLRPRAARRFRRRTARRALSLLEVILAIAILGGAMAAIGVAVRVGTQAALDARELSTAQLLCESKLAEVAAGQTSAMPVGPTPLEVAPDWLYQLDIEPSVQSGLLMVAVTVTRDPQFSSRPVSVTLVRWMIDPDFAAERAGSATAPSSSTGSSSGSGTGTAPGSSGGTSGE